MSSQDRELLVHLGHILPASDDVRVLLVGHVQLVQAEEIRAGGFVVEVATDHVKFRKAHINEEVHRREEDGRARDDTAGKVRNRFAREELLRVAMRKYGGGPCAMRRQRRRIRMLRNR